MATFAVALTAATTPLSAHPSCSSNINDLEDWHDGTATAGDTASEKGQFAVAFRLYKGAGDALFDCAVEIADYHVKVGLAAGNTDEDGLRQSSVKAQYDGAETDYNNAAKAAAALHHASDCHAMVAREREAIKHTDMKGADLSGDDKACAR